jgi:hypothetical protein
MYIYLVEVDLVQLADLNLDLNSSLIVLIVVIYFDDVLIFLIVNMIMKANDNVVAIVNHNSLAVV